MRLAVIGLLLVACKGKSEAPPAPAAKPEVDWAACETALRKAPTVADSARVELLLAGCHVCGDWKPIVEWNKTTQEGGPTRLAIEGAMLACNGYCDANAKQRFLGTLDNARGTDVRTPWRWLGEMCKDKVSAVPDARYMDGTYFALDRIARAVAAHGGEAANLLSQIDLALPALTMTGIGPALPIVEGAKTWRLPRHHVSLIVDDVYVGELPHAHLDGSGVHVDSGAEPYPGHTVALDKVADTWSGETRPQVAILISRATPAQKVADLVAAAGDRLSLYLAVDTGATVASVIPVTLEPKAAAPLAISPEMTAQQLADELEKRSGSVGIVKR